MTHRAIRLVAAFVATLLPLASTIAPARAGGTQATSQASQAQPQGQLVFANLSLEAAQNDALTASPDVAAADARVVQSEDALAAARAGIAPSFVSSYAQAPQGNPPGPAIVSRQVTTGLQLTIGDFVAYRPAVREAAFTLAAAQAERGASLATERVRVVGLYYDALKARALALARRDALALANSQDRAARIRVRAGDAPQLDVLRADVAVAKATAELETAAAADANASDALRIETGVPAGALDATQHSLFAASNARLTDPQTAVALARASRPELRAAALAISAARAAIGRAKASGFPTLTVGGGYLVGTDSGVPIDAPTINAQLSIPLSHANRDRVALATAKVVEAQAKATGVERQITTEVAASARTLGAAERALVATTSARESAAAEERATELGYRNGASSSLELTTARATYSQAVVDELSARYDVEKARAMLEIEVGQ